MNTPGRLGMYGGILAAVFAASYGLGGALVPASVVNRWTAAAAADAHAHGGATTQAEGTSSSANGYSLTGVEALNVVSEHDSALAFTVAGRDGRPVTQFDTVNGSAMHLILVSTDGAVFHHLHPQRDPAGRWWIPWRWERAGTYRLYADFRPSGGPATVLSTLVTVGGPAVTPTTAKVTREATADGYRVELRGDLAAGATSTLTAHVTRDGHDVTALQPYLGSFGHLVVLRDGDLAYAHAHATTEPSSDDATTGPDVSFAVTAPTAGRYVLFLELKVDGTVRTFPLVLETTGTQMGGTDEHGH